MDLFELNEAFAAQAIAVLRYIIHRQPRQQNIMSFIVEMGDSTVLLTYPTYLYMKSRVQERPLRLCLALIGSACALLL